MCQPCMGSTCPIKGSGLLMITIYKENDKSWALCVLVLTFLLLNNSKTATFGPIFMI